MLGIYPKTTPACRGASPRIAELFVENFVKQASQLFFAFGKCLSCSFVNNDYSDIKIIHGNAAEPIAELGKKMVELPR